MTVTVRRPQKSRRCGFCMTNHHANCSVGTLQGDKITIHPCLCEDGGCERGRRRCIDCGNRNTDEVSPDTWKCSDVESCRTTIETKRESNPLLAELRTAKENANMAKQEQQAEKAEKVAKEKEPTFCLVTGEPTKGGKFKPGMDARYVSNHVGAVTEGHQTKDQALAKMKDDGVSATLIAKFEKSLRLAQDKAAKAKAAADAKAAEKDAAKAEKAATPAKPKAPAKG